MGKNKLLAKEVFILILGLFSIAFVNLKPNISLRGNEHMEIEVFSTYVEPGYTASFLFKDVTKKIKVKNDVNVSKIGEYKVFYTLDDKYNQTQKIRYVKVVDKEKPIINLKGSKEAIVCPTQEYVEEGYEVTDNYDTNLTSNVILKKEPDSIIYEVADSSSNKTSEVRKIIYEDNTAPVINLAGSNNMTLYVGSTYSENGYTAFDNCDGDITPKVTVSGSVDTSLVGNYTLTYSVSDSNGNNSTATRTIQVIEKASHVNGVGKTIYLTFDDGPSNTITPGVLQILREEGVKATFFVINKSDSLNYLIKQASDEGHTIGLHSATHNYASIYSSADNYFNDLNIISNKVESIIGYKSNIIRFPGGSSNTISRRYNTGIMSYLTKEVVNRGYYYFDWNISSGDAGGARNENDVYYNVINRLVYQDNIVLLHDFENNYKTLNALRKIIRFGKERGFSFKAITSSTSAVRHGVNN